MPSHNTRLHIVDANGNLLDSVERAPVIRTGERDPIPRSLRHLVYRRDRWTCQYCGNASHAAVPHRRSGALHLDHIIPWSAGGLDRSDNLRTLCGPCNMDRSNFVSRSDQPATPIVGICPQCLAANEPRYASLARNPAETFEVYCACRHHFTWAIPGWRIL